MHLYLFNDLKFTLKRLKRSYMFRTNDHPQGEYIVPCWSYTLKSLRDLDRYVELVLLAADLLGMCVVQYIAWDSHVRVSRESLTLYVAQRTSMPSLMS